MERAFLKSCYWKKEKRNWRMEVKGEEGTKELKKRERKEWKV